MITQRGINMANEIVQFEQESEELEKSKDKDIDSVELIASFFIPSPNGDIFVPRHNITEMINDDMLMDIGRKVTTGYQEDLSSMTDWADEVDAGLELIKQERASKSTPWDGAANFKSPIIMNAALKFSDRASTELLRSRNITTVDTIGDDPDGSKADRSERVSTFINYQLNNEMEEWRDEHEKLLYDLPYIGTAFKKTYFDARLGRNMSDLITYPNFAVNQDSHSTDRLRRFSETFELSSNEVEERFRQGLWVDSELAEESSEDDIEHAEDFLSFIEQQGFFDIDGDGYEEPYTFVVQESTGKVVRISPRFELSDVLVKDENNRRAAKLDTLMDIDGLVSTTGEREIVRIKPDNNITKYGFIRDPQGNFLDVGYFHLLSSLNAGINLLTNQLVNSGTLSNLQGGWTSQGFRKKAGDMSFKPGVYKQTNLTTEELQTGMRDHNFKEPSPTLFSLMQLMVSDAQELTASTDLKGALGANAPATTTLALVQEQQQSTGAIILRIYRSMSKEFLKLYKLNSKFLDPLEYQQVLDDPSANFEQDFNVSDIDIVPVANPEVTSKIQRIQQAQVEMSQLQAVMLAGGDVRSIIKNFYTSIGSENVDEIFPELSPQERLQVLLSENPDLAALITGEQERQDLLAAAQADAVDRETIMREMELQSKLDKEESEIIKNESATILNLEKAESEDVKNAVSTYTTAVQLDKEDIQNQQMQQQPLQPQQP